MQKIKTQLLLLLLLL